MLYIFSFPFRALAYPFSRPLHPQSTFQFSFYFSCCCFKHSAQTQQSFHYSVKAGRKKKRERNFLSFFFIPILFPRIFRSCAKISTSSSLCCGLIFGDEGEEMRKEEFSVKINNKARALVFVRLCFSVSRREFFSWKLRIRQMARLCKRYLSLPFSLVCRLII